MELIFGAAPRIGSLFLRIFTFSRWSHVGVVNGDEVIEAHFPRVRSVPLAEFKANYPTWEMADLPTPDDARAWQFCRDQIGKLYDVGALFAFPFQRRDWESPNRWFCSELPVAAANAAGAHYYRDSELSRITPGELWAVTR